MKKHQEISTVSNYQGVYCVLNQNGQSIVEYLVICGVLVMALVTMPSIYQEMSHTMQNKYKSYCFGVAISDPPRKAFDDAINKDANEIHKIITFFQKLEHFITNVVVPDIINLRLPDQKEIQEFLDTIKDLF